MRNLTSNTRKSLFPCITAFLLILVSLMSNVLLCLFLLKGFCQFPFHLNQFPLCIYHVFYLLVDWASWWLNAFAHILLSPLSSADYLPFSPGVSEGPGDEAGADLRITEIDSIC